MSVRSRSSIRASARHFVILQVVTALLVAGCADGVFSPNTTGRGQLQLRPVFSSVDWQSLSANINVIRLTATQLPGGSVVLKQETNVDPVADEWQLALDVPVNSDLEVLVELINRIGSVDVVVYSGRTRIQVKQGGQPLAAVIPVFPGPPDNLDITSLVLAPKNQSLLEGDQLQLAANVVGSANPTIIWTSSNTDVAAVDENGVVRGLVPGTVTIQATAGPKSDNVTVDVGARATAIQMAPNTITLSSIDEDGVFSAKVVDQRNSQIELPITYQISDPAIAVEVGPGKFRAKRSGVATVTATAEQRGRTITASATLKVQQTPAKLSVNPPAQTFSALGQTLAFSADARDAKGNPVSISNLNWTSSNPSVAAVSASGDVTAVGNGTAVIGVQSGTLTAEATVTVDQVAAELNLTPDNVRLNVGKVAQMNATVRDARGNVMAVPITWSVENNPGAGSVSSNGLVTAIRKGQATIRARYGSLSATSILTVLQPPTQVLFDRVELSLSAGATGTVAAYLAEPDGTPVRGPITYSSENTSIATVDSTGKVTAVSAGTTHIVAKAQGFQARLPVQVQPEPPAQIQFDIPQVAISVNGSMQVHAMLSDAHGGPVPGGSIAYSVANPMIASVNSTGLVKGLTAGKTEVIASAATLQARIPVTVAPPAVATQILFDRTALEINKGESVQVRAYLADANGQPVTGDPISFVSANNAIATVSPLGVVTGMASGSTKILAISQGMEGRLSTTVRR